MTSPPHAVSTTCAVCGASLTLGRLASTSAFGSPDLDGRPPETARSTLPYWIERCAWCGYIAEDISMAAPGTADLVRSAAYRAIDAKRELPELARAFVKHAFLSAAAGQRFDAGEAYMHAAWACDDAGAEDQARSLRLQAADTLEFAARKRRPEFVELPLVLVDLRRRAGDFVGARRLLDAVDDPSLSPRLLAMADLQRSLLAEQDSSGHRFDVEEKVGPAVWEQNDTLGYIRRNYRRLLRKAEREALDARPVEVRGHTGWTDALPRAQALLGQGVDAFADALVARLSREHADEFVLNRCPRCGALARTPKARECPKCPHTWRE